MIGDKALEYGLGLKGYNPDVATALAPFGAEQLLAMGQIDDATFGRYAKAGPGNSATHTAAFNQAYEGIKKLGRTNVAFATHVAERYKQNPDSYNSLMNNMAKTLASNPEAAQKVAELTRANNAKKMTDLFGDFDRTGDAAVDRLLGKMPASTVAVNTPKSNPASVTQAPAKPIPAGVGKKTVTNKSAPGDSPARQAQLARMQKQAEAEGGSSEIAFADSLAPGEEGVEKEAGPSSSGPLNFAQAKTKFEKMMADPKNELAVQIHERGMEGDILKRLEKDPTLIKNFDFAANRTQYLALLKEGKKADFLSEFGGPEMPKPGAQQAGLFGGLGEMGSKLGDMVKGFLTGGPNSLMGMFGQLKEIMGRVFGGNVGVLGVGTNLTAMLNNPNTPRLDPDYLAGHAYDLRKNLQSENPDLRRHAERGLKELGVTDRGDLHDLQQGRAYIQHVGIETKVTKDDKGNVVSTQKFAKGHVARYEGLEEMKTTVAANDPSVQAAPKVVGSDVTQETAVTRPVQIDRPNTARPLDQEPTMAPSTPSGGAV